jgi:glycosyltransferase involved in cell wall biosynthesis
VNKIFFFPAVTTLAELTGIVNRSAWHLNLLDNYEFIIYTKSSLNLTDITKVEGFTNEVNKTLSSFISKIKLVNFDGRYTENLVVAASAVLKWKENDIELNDFLKKNCLCTIYRVDPEVVRQEGSFYIQCAFDLLPDKERLINESRLKFSKLYNDLGIFQESWVLATGPSVEKYQEHDFENKLTIACNSTILDDELMTQCKPKIVVFADPIFHFGVSEYAGEFRDIVRYRLETTDISIILPFKYYALFLSVFPEYSERIIGVPLDATIEFNADISHSFAVKSTANILTLLLLPVASTFSNTINILGCDGRSFDDDDYFWGHGKTVQINSKMDNIKEVHPGFFKIDYNEYYFEHCHTLECLMQKGEAQGNTYQHHADSFIPALRDRNDNFEVTKSLKGKHILLIEPDGIGVNGHYVPWYNQVIGELNDKVEKLTVLCNLKQTPNLYVSEGIPVFTSHSWGISRGDWCFKKGYEKHASFIRFFSELESSIVEYCKKNNTQQVTLFMYYGSTQILSGFHSLRKKLKGIGIDTFYSICLFHESVILNAKVTNPRLPPNARNVLLEGVSQSDSYTVTSVTNNLREFIYNKVDVMTTVMPNPIPNGDAKKKSTILKYDQNREYRIVFPCALREEKGGELVKNLIQDITKNKVDVTGFHFYIRKIDGVDYSNIDSIIEVEDNISDENYDQLLQSADAIVIPYLAPHFTYRTSGIVVDAMFARKPIIVLEKTWLANVIKKQHAGIAIKYLSSSSFVSAFKVFKMNHEILSKHSRHSFKKYQEEHSWKSLIETMLLS